MVSYPYCYRLSRIIWLLVGLAWVSTIIGAKSELIRTMLLDRNGRLRAGRYWRHGKGNKVGHNIISHFNVFNTAPAPP